MINKKKMNIEKINNNKIAKREEMYYCCFPFKTNTNN